MLDRRLRYGFLTTYNETIFVKRADCFRFEASKPITFNSISPSVRECFLFLASRSVKDGTITNPDFYGKEPEVSMQLFRGAIGYVNSTREYLYRSSGSGASNITRNSVIIGRDSDNFSVTVKEQIGRRIFKVEDASGKCWIL
jgi:hypothetical protein